MPTIGLSIEEVYVKDYKLTFWDVGGQATKMWKHYFDSVDGLVFVIDSTDRDRIAKAKDELNKAGRDPQLLHAPILLMFNKIDKVDERMGLEELIEKMDVAELSAMSENRVINFQECSASTSEGLWEGLNILLEIFERKDLLRPSVSASQSISILA